MGKQLNFLLSLLSFRFCEIFAPLSNRLTCLKGLTLISGVSNLRKAPLTHMFLRLRFYPGPSD
jgi:hypothetical protein